MVFDGACPVCSATVAAIERLDRGSRFAYLDARDRPSLAETLPQVDPDAALAKIHLVLPDRRIRTGFEAVRAILARLPGLRGLSWALGLPGVRALGEKGYAAFSKRRPRDPSRPIVRRTPR